MPRPLLKLDELFPYWPLAHMLARRRQAVHAVAPGDPVQAALRLMAEHDIGLVLVLEGGRLVGVLSERDLARRAGASDGGALGELRVADLMTRDVATVGPEALFGECIALMEQRGARHLPVVEGGRVVGVLSVRDLLREALAHHQRVMDEMERERLTAFQSSV